MLSPYLPPDWDAIDPDADPAVLALAVYPDEDELLAAEVFRAGERVFSRIAVAVAGGLFAYMLIGITVAYEAGRL